MTEENTAAPVVETTAPAPVAQTPANVPGNPGQTLATLKRLEENPELADWLINQYNERTGKAAAERSAMATAQDALLKVAVMEAALEYGIPKDKLLLIQDSTPEGVSRRAAELATLLKPSAPTPAAAPADTPAPAAPAEPPRPAGVALPAATAPVPVTPQNVQELLIAQFTANPLPKPPGS